MELSNNPGTRNFCTAAVLPAELALPTCGSEVQEAWLKQVFDSDHPTSLLPVEAGPAVVVAPSSKPVHLELETTKKSGVASEMALHSAAHLLDQVLQLCLHPVPIFQPCNHNHCPNHTPAFAQLAVV